jgi:RsiW-degrading membrane proteinase PrsW (M82 family)
MSRSHAVLLATVAAPLAWFLRFGWGIPPIVIMAAAIPASVAAWLTTRLIRAPRDDGLMIASFLGGAVLAAFVSSSGNTFLMGWLTSLTGEAHARLFAPAFGAPMIEEAGKALALLTIVLLWRAPAHVVEGAACGALVGIGFAMTENLGYLTLALLHGGLPGLAQGVYLRSLIGSAVHATFTASTGAGVGYARQTRATAARLFAAVTGLLFAVTQHLAWNAIAAGTIRDLLCRATTPVGACSSPSPLALFVTVPAVVALTIGPGIVALIVLARRSRLGST